MASRTYSLLITPREWCEVIQSVSESIALHGVLHKWPNHRYEPLEIWRLDDQVMEEGACEITIRSTPLEHGVELKEFVDAYPRRGMIGIDVPQIKPVNRLNRIYIAMRAEDAAHSGAPDPTPLFNALLKILKKISFKPVVDNVTGEVYRSVHYTEGALILFRQGFEWAFDPRDSTLLKPG